MATIRKRGDLQWQAIVKRQGHPLQSKTFTNRKDAEAWATVIESEMVRGVFVSRAEAERTTLNECIERYEEEVTPTKRGAKQETYRLAVLKRSKLAPLAMAAIRGQDVAKFRDARRDEGIAANTIKNDLNTLSAVFEHSRREWGINTLNPVRDVKRPSPPPGRDRRLLGDEAARLLEACDKSPSPWLGSVVRLALETAMRLSEVASLNWKDIDLAHRVAKVRGVEGRETKNSDVFRAVPLSLAAADVLRRLPRNIAGRVFPIGSIAIQHGFRAAVKKVGIEDFRFHDLRHEATSRLFERGVFDSMEVASITGHKTLAMLKRYTHLKAEDLARKMG